MTLITWLSCLAILWTKVVHTQADDVDPLVMVVYPPKYDEKRITFVDLTIAKPENLKLPLDDAEPEYFVLLCGDTDGNFNQSSTLIVEQVTKEINSEEILKCKHHPLPALTNWGTTETLNLISIDYNLDIKSWKQKNPNNESSELLTDFNEKFNKKLNDNIIRLLYIEYNYKHNIPVSIKHTVKAHMHSNTDEGKCEQIIFGISIGKYVEPPSDTLHNTEVPDYQWRQLVPMQDFKDIYVTNATCIYLNFLLLHKDTIETLKKVESFIRDVANIINEVRVESGTYTPKEEVSLVGNESNETIIPSIVWKEITHQGSSKDYYTVLVVIHNRKTERICERSLRHWGWPKFNYKKHKNDIGYTYYCFFEKKVWDLLKIRNQKGQVRQIFNLRKLPFEKDNKKETINVKSEIKKNKQATSNSDGN